MQQHVLIDSAFYCSLAQEETLPIFYVLVYLFKWADKQIEFISTFSIFNCEPCPKFIQVILVTVGQANMWITNTYSVYFKNWA